MVQRYTGIISRSGCAWSTRKTVIISPVHARAATKGFLHLWLRAGAACQVSIATNGRETGSRKVVLEGGITEASRPLSRGVIVIRGGSE